MVAGADPDSGREFSSPAISPVDALFHSSPTPMWIYDRDTLQFLEVNDAAVDHYGWTRDEFRRRTLLDIRPLDDHEALQAHINEPAEDELFRDSGVWRHVTKDGRLLYVHITSHRANLEGREVVVVASLDRTPVVLAARRTTAQFELGLFADQLDTDQFLAASAPTIGRAVDSPDTAVHLVNPDDTIALVSATGRLHDRLVDPTHHDPVLGGDSAWRRALRTGRTIIDNHASDDEGIVRDLGDPYVARVAIVPMQRSGRVEALLTVANKPGRYTDDDVTTLQVLGDLALHMLDRKAALTAKDRALSLYEQAAWASVTALARTTEARDPYTAGHQRRVGILASHIGHRLGMSDHEVDGLRVAGTLHDLGKIGVPAEILTRPGRLTDAEMQLIRTHPSVGAQILEGIEYPWPVRDVVLQHHERLDGSGYPLGLQGDQICLEARIVAVADVIEAMTTMRPYRAELGLQAAISEVVAHRGTHYDPDVVDAAVAVLHEFGGIPETAILSPAPRQESRPADG